MTKGIEFLKSILVKDFPQVDKNDGNVVVLQDTDTLKDAMKVPFSFSLFLRFWPALMPNCRLRLSALTPILHLWNAVSSLFLSVSHTHTHTHTHTLSLSISLSLYLFISLSLSLSLCLSIAVPLSHSRWC